ncbi:MAG: tRNA preQ1(34) S-adenosylmethionine ribosyltransferase-isomerase QueA [Vampirovibrionales bacterium]
MNRFTPSTVDLNHLAAYDYPLPKERIARYPLAQRDASKMMVVDRARGTLEHHHFYDLPQFLSSKDLVVMNNTRVLPCRVYGKRYQADGTLLTGEVTLLFLHPVDASPSGLPQWRVLMKPAKKLPVGTRIQLNSHASSLQVTAYNGNGEAIVAIELVSDGNIKNVDDLLQAAGEMPIPPYLNRHAEQADSQSYQTIYAKVSGSQAAPTAGLHFTPAVLEALNQQGTKPAEITLTVSLGTFREVQSEAIHQHRMDGEYYTVEADAAQAITQCQQQGGRVIAIGTTTTKTLETVAHTNNGRIVPQCGVSELFITPGFTFQATDGLLTNFHMPRSTLLMLVSAFAGYDLMMAAYQSALENDYRFYSYGDCMLIL